MPDIKTDVEDGGISAQLCSCEEQEVEPQEEDGGKVRAQRLKQSKKRIKRRTGTRGCFMSISW